MNKPELVSPAGNLEKLNFAFAYGADAVYAGIPGFSLRVKENEFNIEQLAQAIKHAHENKKKIYLTCNILAHNNKVNELFNVLEKIVPLNPDALIVADPGFIYLIKDKFPKLKLHLSVQACSLNWASAQFWYKQGVERIIVPREISIAEIKEIKQKNPKLELECFIHGAICISYSGRCLISNYLAQRDANLGECVHSCRWNYALREATRPDDLFPIEEDKHGTYLFNSKDLCALPVLKELVDSGIDALKIEGRNKTIYYLALVTQTYRKAIDSINKLSQKEISNFQKELESTSNRGFITGFLKENPKEKGQDYAKCETKQTHLFAGKVVKYNPQIKLAEIEVKNRFDIGMELEFIMAEKRFKQKIINMYDEKGKKFEHAHGGGKNVFIKVEQPVDSLCLLRMPFYQPKKVLKTNI